MRWGFLITTAATVSGFALAVACDSIDRDAPPRFYVAPDADDDTSASSTSSSGSSGSVDGGLTDAVGDALLDSDAPRETVDLSTVVFSGWWRASYAGSPWTGMASAGASKGRDLTEATTPPLVGPAINGLTPAGFNGTTTKLQSTIAVSSYLAANAWEVYGLFSADAAKPYAAGTPYTLPALLTDSIGGSFYVSFGSTGVVIGHYDGTYKELSSPCATGGLHVFQAWYDGAKLNLMVDGGTPVSSPANAAIFGVGLLRVGANYTNAAFYEGRIVEIMMASQVLGGPTRSAVRKYFNERYGTAFPL